MSSVFRSELQMRVTIFVKPKLPFDAVSSATRLPNSPQIRMTYASSAITSSSVATHCVRNAPFHSTSAPTIEPAMRNASHFFVTIAPTTITSTIRVAISP